MQSIHSSDGAKFVAAVHAEHRMQEAAFVGYLASMAAVVALITSVAALLTVVG